MNLEHFAASLDHTSRTLRQAAEAEIAAIQGARNLGQHLEVPAIQPMFTAGLLMAGVAAAIRAGLDPNWKAPPNG